MELAVVMPIYNEAVNIETVAGEWMAELDGLGIGFSILAINDGSKDDTGAVLKSLAVRFPNRLIAIDQANAGHGRACRAGYDFAARNGFAWTLQIDSDGQCDPSFFPAFWTARETADCVFGLRTKRDDGTMRSLLSTGCRLVTSAICGLDLKDANVPYRLIRTAVLGPALAKIPGDFDMQNVALTVALKREPALRWRYIPIHFRGRQGGTNSINLVRILSMGWKLVRNFGRIGG